MSCCPQNIYRSDGFLLRHSADKGGWETSLPPLESILYEPHNSDYKLWCAVRKSMVIPLEMAKQHIPYKQ